MQICKTTATFWIVIVEASKWATEHTCVAPGRCSMLVPYLYSYLYWWWFRWNGNRVRLFGWIWFRKLVSFGSLFGRWSLDNLLLGGGVMGFRWRIGVCSERLVKMPVIFK